MLNSFQQLVEEHQGRLKAEFLTAKIEQVLKTGPKQVSDQENELVLNRDALLDQFGETNALEGLKILDLSQQLRKLLVEWLCLDCHLSIVIVLILGQVHLSKGSLTNFLYEAKLLSNKCAFD